MPMPFQEKLLLEADLSPIRALHHAAWVRMEFKSDNENWGVVRVYVLPDDVARAEIDRNQSSLRKALIVLLNSLDISKTAWNSQCSEADRFIGILSPATDKEIEEPSLFDIFNTLSSPNPQPETITESYIQDAMYKILENKVEGISTTLYSYQQQSAAMMLQRETTPAQIIDPRLSVFLDQHDKPWYCDASTGTILREPKFYEAARGGICAETMGLGKTLICLTVILATKELSSKIPEEVLGNLPVRKKTGTLLEMAASNIGQNGSPWRHWLTRMESEGYELTNVRRALEKGLGHYFLQPPAPRRVSRNPAKQAPRKILLSSTTIVVVPPNLVQQWLREIDKHTIEGSLNLLLMDDWKKDLPAAEKLLEYDIILFSKPRFEYEARDQQPNVESEDGSSRRINSNKKRSNGTNGLYRSPLEDIHFKRLIIDEGHAFGNATRSSKTEATTVVDFLRLSARWIISGTPTKGLYGIEVASINSSKSSTPHSTPSESSGILRNGSPLIQAPPSDAESSRSAQILSQPQIERLYVHERKDIEKLGNIATLFLKIRPWANSPDDQDAASWSQYVMQPRHGSKSRGNTDCLRKTLEGMIIRHRPEDVVKDVTLPPLHHDFVYLDGSIQNKLSLNTFAMMIITNAVTSERKDADYFFHSRQRKNLQQLVSNLRQGSFFWSGFETEHIQSTVNNAKKFLEERKVPVTAEDEGLLLQAIKIGEIVLVNNISQLIGSSHEMPMYIENHWDEEVRKAWALDRDIRNPTLMGATLVHNAQRLVQSQLYKTDPMEGLIEAGNKNMQAAFEPHNIRPPPDPLPTRRSKSLKRLRPAEVPPELAGGVTVGDGSSPRKKSRASATRSPGLGEKVNDIISHTLDPLSGLSLANGDGQPRADEIPRKSVVLPLKSALKQSSKADLAGTLDPNSPLASTFIVSTASVKLSYLMDRIVVHHASEKIIVFYESDNVAYYIAQGLECLGIKHLIYAKSLHSSRRSKYVVTFNQTDVFRVLLMDVSQAAFGLDLSSASRVFFVNPVFSPQVEAQAVKRAHRIGQGRPVYVETLVLKGSIEEIIVQRRKDMSEQEHQKCKTILDDQTMYDWIQNVRFLDVPSKSVPGPEQMAALEHKQPLFRAGISVGGVADPDADLVGDPTPKKSPKGKNKSVKLSFAITDDMDGT
jgi:SNF2 family DNA or RNA helicase